MPLLKEPMHIHRHLLQRAALAALALPGLAGLLAIASPAHAATAAPTHATNSSAASKPKPTAPSASPHGKTLVPKPRTKTSAVHPMIPWAVSLTASPANPWVTQSTTLTATTNSDVGPTPYYIYIYQLDGAYPQLAARCGSGSICSVPATEGEFDTNSFVTSPEDFVAYVAGYSTSTTSLPPNIQARSSDVIVSWQTVGPVSLSATANTVPVGASSTLTATTGVDIGPSPFFIQIWDTTGGGANLLAECGSGTSCSTTVSQGAATTGTYVATVAEAAYYLRLPNGIGWWAYPPAAQQSSSPTTYITWNDSGWRVSLSTAPYSTVITATANGDVGPTIYYIYIYDENTGAWAATPCFRGVTCTASVNGYGIALVAFIAPYSSAALPAGIIASSNTVLTDYSFVP